MNLRPFSSALHFFLLSEGRIRDGDKHCPTVGNKSVHRAPLRSTRGKHVVKLLNRVAKESRVDDWSKHNGL